MESFFKAFAGSKIPTLLVLLLLYGFGSYLMVNSTKNENAAVAGGSVLVLAVVLTVITFVDYRNKEHVEHLLKSYSDALDTISKTHSTFETKEQNNFSTSVSDANRIGANGEYSVSPIQGTPTE